MDSPRLFSILLLACLVISISFSSAEYSIDISGLKSTEYANGEAISLKVILLEDSKLINVPVELKLNDVLDKKIITRIVNSNEQVTIPIESDFRSGLWEVSASYSGASTEDSGDSGDIQKSPLESFVKRTFTITEHSDAEFLIDEDELIIRNNGNTRYTKTIQIKIGGVTNSYTQNIGVGEEKRLKLISPKGFYNIEVTDGKTILKRENIELFGTGNVIGAMDPELVGYTGFAGTTDPSKLKDSQTSIGRLPVVVVFIIAVFVLAALVLVERKLSKSHKGK